MLSIRQSTSTGLMLFHLAAAAACRDYHGAGLDRRHHCERESAASGPEISFLRTLV
jgi:hypothetical protein